MNCNRKHNFSFTIAELHHMIEILTRNKID